MVSFLKDLWKKFITLNLFESDDTSEDSIYQQRISTHIYIITLILGIFILLIISSIRIETSLIEVKNPSLSTYSKLLALDKSNTLKCPCTEILPTYGDFVQITPYYHQVCSSDLISLYWISFLFDMIKSSTLYALLFERTANNNFQVLRELCQSSQSTVNDSLAAFYSTQLISAQLLSEQLLNAETNASINDFQLNLRQKFHSSLSFIRTFTMTNTLITAINTAYSIIVFNFNGVLVWGPTGQWYMQSDQSYCECSVTPTCHLRVEKGDSEQVTGITYIQDNNIQFVSDWYVACWPIESLLLSSLTAFYNQSALDFITDTTRFMALIPLNSVHSNINTTIDDLVNKLFIEKWVTNISYVIFQSVLRVRRALGILEIL